MRPCPLVMLFFLAVPGSRRSPRPSPGTSGSPRPRPQLRRADVHDARRLRGEGRHAQVRRQGREEDHLSTPGAVPEPVDWGLAERLARRVAGHDPLESSYLAASLQADFDAVTARAEHARRGVHRPRLPPDDPARALVLDRQHWVDANLRSFRNTLEPFTSKVGERMAQSPFAPAGRAVAGAEMGVLMGFLAQRVLGQYDLLGPDDRRRRRRRRLLRRPQHPGAGEALRVPARRLPAVDRPPRGHPPGPVPGASPG